MSETSTAFATAIIGSALLLASAITYIYFGGSTGYLLVLIALIVGVSSIRIKRATLNDLKDAGNTMTFFGILTLISLVMFLSGVNGHGPAYYLGLAGSIMTILAGLLSYRSTKVIVFKRLTKLLDILRRRS